MAALGRTAAIRGTAHTASALALAALLAGCATSGPGAGPSAPRADFPAVRFAVIADPHLFDAAASTPGPALDRAIGSDIKLHVESAEILAEAIAAIAAEHPDFLLVCGDLTRNGERAAHELAASMLGALDDAGVPVLVVPGNHDVRNPHAARFTGETVEAVASVEPADFAALYAGLGYAEALERDPASLSYVAEPVPGLRVLALDACRYDGEAGSPRTDGRLSQPTRAWAARVLARARADGVATIAFLHHAMVPHFTDMERWLDPYLLDGHDAAARILAGAGVRLAFTGHGHAQDVVRGDTREGPVWDVETGSLASWPNPWRLVEIGPEGSVRISSRRVTAIPSLGSTFASYAEFRLTTGLWDAAIGMLDRMGVRGQAASAIARRAVAAGSAFHAGDEPGPAPPVDRSVLGTWARLAEAVVREFLDAMGTDLEPADNDLTLSVE